MVFKSAQEIFRPTGVLIPVVSMSMRPLIGIVQALVSPGILTVASSLLTSCSGEIASGVTWRNTRLAHSGAHAEYHVFTRDPCARGLRIMPASTMESAHASLVV